MKKPFTKEQIPEVEMGPDGVRPESWEAIRRWAIHNDPHWGNYERIAHINNITEVEKLKLLVVHYLRVQEETRNRLIQEEQRRIIIYERVSGNES